MDDTLTLLVCQDGRDYQLVMKQVDTMSQLKHNYEMLTQCDIKVIHSIDTVELSFDLNLYCLKRIQKDFTRQILQEPWLLTVSKKNSQMTISCVNQKTHAYYHYDKLAWTWDDDQYTIDDRNQYVLITSTITNSQTALYPVQPKTLVFNKGAFCGYAMGCNVETLQLTLSHDDIKLTMKDRLYHYETTIRDAFDQLIVDPNAKPLKTFKNLTPLEQFEWIALTPIQNVNQQENTIVVTFVKNHCVRITLNKVTTKVSKTLEQCQKEYKERREAITQLTKALEKYPKSYAALTESFWKQFFEDHQVDFRPILGVDDYGYRFKIQSILKDFDEIDEKPTPCLTCQQNKACYQSTSCLACCSSQGIKNVFTFDNVNVDKVLSLLPKTTIIDVFTSCGTLSLSLEQFKHTIQGVVKVHIDHCSAIFQQKQMLFYIRMTRQEIVDFLAHQSGVNLIY